MAQAFGAGDYHSMRKNIANSYYLGALIGVLLTILTMIGTGTILHWMKTPDDIYQYSYDYIIVFSAAFHLVLYNSLLRSCVPWATANPRSCSWRSRPC
ncbi:MAG: MATE family efflux transporter [Ruminococcus callidus]